MLNQKLLFLSLCTVGLSAGAMSLDQLGTGGEAKVAKPAHQEDQELAFLIQSAREGNISLMHYSILSGVDVFGCNKWGKTALRVAAEWGQLDSCDYLIPIMLELSATQINQIYSSVFCLNESDKMSALNECALPVAERLCQALYEENKKRTFEELKKIDSSDTRKLYLKRYFPGTENIVPDTGHQRIMMV